MTEPRKILESTPLVFVVTLLAVLSVQAVTQFADGDLWGRLGLAALWVGSGKFPYHDVFSFTARGADWIDHEWLSGVLFYSLLRGFGEAGFLIFKDLVITAVLFSIFYLHRRIYRVTSNYALLGLLATIPMTSIGFRATIRCQVFSLLFFLLFLLWLEMIRLKKRNDQAVLALIPLGILWTNLHGGFLAGLLLILGYGAGKVWQQRSLWSGRFYFVTSALIFAGTVISPYGLSYPLFFLRAWTFDRSDISEWTPLWHFSSDQWMVWTFIFLVGGFVFLRLFVWREKNEDIRSLAGPLAAIVLLISLTLMAYHRFQMFLAFGTVALLPVFLPAHLFARRWAPEFKLRPSHLVVIGAIFFAAKNFTSPNSHPLTAPLPSIVFPAGAVQYLRETHAQGHLVAPLFAAEFMTWALYPNMRVAFDGRFEELYSLAEIRSWLNFLRTPISAASAEVAEGPIARGADWIITPLTTPGAALSLSKNDKWVMEYQDSLFTLWHLHGKKILVQTPDQDFDPTIESFLSDRDLERFK